MKKRLPFLCLFVIFALMTAAFFGMGLSPEIRSSNSRLIFRGCCAAVGAAASLLGMIFPDKFQELLKKKDKE